MRETETHTLTPCLQTHTDGWSVRETEKHTPDSTDDCSLLRETQTHTHSMPTRLYLMAGRSSGRHKHTHTHSLPTRPQRLLVIGQGDTHTHTLHTYTLCQDRTDGWSLVKETHTHTHTHAHTHVTLPTRLHRWLVPSQTDTYACKHSTQHVSAEFYTLVGKQASCQELGPGNCGLLA